MRGNSKIRNKRDIQTTKKELTIEKVLIYVIIMSVITLIFSLIFHKPTTKNDIPPMQENAITEAEEDVPIEVILHKEFKNIDGQSTYIAFNKNAKNEEKFPMVIYSHGSTYTVSEDKNNPLTKDLDYYADIFVKEGYIFAASNQHGDNWGNATAIEDTRKLVEELNNNYKGNSEVYLLGFSMGGLVTMNYAEKYPENIKKIALLAPTSYAKIWNAKKVERIKQIPTRIWHGNKDVNVPYSMTTEFIRKLGSLGKEIELITVEGAGHFDIDTEYTDAIVEFYKSH